MCQAASIIIIIIIIRDLALQQPQSAHPCNPGVCLQRPIRSVFIISNREI